MYPYQFELWEAINDYAESCGGETSDKTARRPGRIKAVVAVEEIIEKLRFASQLCNPADGGKCICGATDPLAWTPSAHLKNCPFNRR